MKNTIFKLKKKKLVKKIKKNAKFEKIFELIGSNSILTYCHERNCMKTVIFYSKS